MARLTGVSGRVLERLRISLINEWGSSLWNGDVTHERFPSVFVLFRTSTAGIWVFFHGVCTERTEVPVEEFGSDTKLTQSIGS